MEITMRGVKGALLRYRILAYIVGVGLLILTLVGMPLQYIAGKPEVVTIVGPIHGFFYIVYLVFGFDMSRRARLTLFQTALVVCAGFLPFLAFIIEHKITKIVEQRTAPGFNPAVVRRPVAPGSRATVAPMSAGGVVGGPLSSEEAVPPR
jgi:integral membrane protein